MRLRLRAACKLNLWSERVRNTSAERSTKHGMDAAVHFLRLRSGQICALCFPSIDNVSRFYS